MRLTCIYNVSDRWAVDLIQCFLNARLRKIIKTRGHFPSDDAASKLIWLALKNITTDWGRASHNWKAAMNQFAILYEDRFTQAKP